MKNIYLFYQNEKKLFRDLNLKIRFLNLYSSSYSPWNYNQKLYFHYFKN